MPCTCHPRGCGARPLRPMSKSLIIGDRKSEGYVPRRNECPHAAWMSTGNHHTHIYAILEHMNCGCNLRYQHGGSIICNWQSGPEIASISILWAMRHLRSENMDTGCQDSFQSCICVTHASKTLTNYGTRVCSRWNKLRVRGIQYPPPVIANMNIYM